VPRTADRSTASSCSQIGASLLGSRQIDPLYAKGWGWALFEAKDPKKNVATSFDASCKACHIPAQQDDWVYIRGYPILNPALRK
jgi:hypothetical protein